MVDRRLWLLLPRPIRELPADLSAVIILVIITNLTVFLPIVRETPLRVIFGLAFVLFLPGYAFIAALFPEAGTGPIHGDDEDADIEERKGGRLRDRGIDGIERVALSFGLSIAIVPMVGLILNFTPWGIRLVPIVVSVSGFTVVCTGVAARRRWELPTEERFRVPYDAWLASARTEVFEPETRSDAALNVLLALSIVLAVSSVGYAVAVPKQGEQFTEFYLLTENESGDLVAANYPTEFELGERKSVVVGIGNHEHEPMDYTVVVELQEVRVENNSTTVLDETELGRLKAHVKHNETWQRPYEIKPTMTGERLRLLFLLYRGDAHSDPTAENAYRELHLWVNVSTDNTSTAVIGRSS